jgi:DNA-binding response OmpR family regulator
METILVQENDEATLEAVTAALELKGYRVCPLNDYDENALNMIRRHRPKLVLLDCWLNDRSGKQMGQWIKSHFRGLPVVAFSCDNHIDEHYHELGFDDYLKKPFDLEVLYKVIKKHLPKHRRRLDAAALA